MKAPRGAILVEGSVAGDDPNFGSSRVEPERLEASIAAAGEYAVAVSREIDHRNDVQHVAAAIGILDANSKVFGRRGCRTRSPTAAACRCRR